MKGIRRKGINKNVYVSWQQCLFWGKTGSMTSNKQNRCSRASASFIVGSIIKQSSDSDSGTFKCLFSER